MECLPVKKDNHEMLVLIQDVLDNNYKVVVAIYNLKVDDSGQLHVIGRRMNWSYNVSMIKLEGVTTL